MSPPAHFRQQGHLGLLGAVGSLAFGLLHQGLVSEDGLELVAPNGKDKEAKEDGLQNEDDRVQDPGLLGEHGLSGDPDGLAGRRAAAA